MEMKFLVFIVIVFSVLQMSNAGFGCPGNQSKCNRHCKSVHCRAGYCDAWTAWLRCTCSRCSRSMIRAVNADEPSDENELLE